MAGVATNRCVPSQYVGAPSFSVFELKLFSVADSVDLDTPRINQVRSLE
ncbi:hypothetical protein OH492_10065 [Vibrio chagasii]|nr:hypothetical protein [Vibrio chagasii]